MIEWIDGIFWKMKAVLQSIVRKTFDADIQPDTGLQHKEDSWEIHFFELCSINFLFHLIEIAVPCRALHLLQTSHSIFDLYIYNINMRSTNAYLSMNLKATTSCAQEDYQAPPSCRSPIIKISCIVV